MAGVLRAAFAQGLSPNQPVRDRLLFAIGTTAIIWYFVGIIFLGLYPLTAAMTKALPKNEPAGRTPAPAAVKPLDELIATRREKAKAARAAADKEPDNTELRTSAETAEAELKA